MPRVVIFEEFGPASVLQLVERDLPDPPAGKIRVAVRAAGINPVDIKLRSGAAQGYMPVTLPGRLGREFAGVVDALGDGVSGVAVGDPVFGINAGTALADFTIANPDNVTPKPTALPWDVAGSLPLVGLTAWDSFESQHVVADDTVLVSAAAGGVGLLVAQLAVAAGATVIGTAGASNHEFLSTLGITPIAYGPGLASRIRDVAPQGVTVVFDHHGAETVETALELGVDRARINSISGVATTYDVQAVGRGPISTGTLDELARRIMASELRFEIDSVYPLAEVVQAYEHLEAGHVRGKVVVCP